MADLPNAKSLCSDPTADPVYLYTDDVVGIVPERHINNGQPSLHAFLLSQAALRAGEHIVHVGAGAGYYSAIMANLVAASGRVTAIEFKQGLLRGRKQISLPIRSFPWSREMAAP